jgi:hypothetical protein
MRERYPIKVKSGLSPKGLPPAQGDLQAKLVWRGPGAEKYHYYSLFIVWKQGLLHYLVTIQPILPEQLRLWGIGSLMVQWKQFNPGGVHCAPIDPLRTPHTIPARGGALQANETPICCLPCSCPV